jgi:hypothetical protein
MAAFTAEDQTDRRAFLNRMSRLRADTSISYRVIDVDGAIAGTIGSLTSVRFEYWREPGSDALASTATSHPVAVRRSRKRSCALTEVGTELRRVLRPAGFSTRLSTSEQTARSAMWLAATKKAPPCGAFAEPSDGLEPSTPSLPWNVARNRWQSTATVYFRGVWRGSICRRLPLVATTGLHKGSFPLAMSAATTLPLVSRVNQHASAAREPDLVRPLTGQTDGRSARTVM